MRKYERKAELWKGDLPEDKSLPKDVRGYPNRSYLGHTSEFFETPYANEGKFVEPGEPRRIPNRKDRTREMEQERKRLAAIENPGRCQARMVRYDGWCRKRKLDGLEVCMIHGGRFKHSKEAAARRVAKRELEEGARKIVERAKK